jgi:hypothetical protein
MTTRTVQVLIDADNLAAPRRHMLAALLNATPSAGGERIVVAGRQQSLADVAWPAAARLLPAAGWQRADHVLVHAYVLDDEPLLLATGDGDFVHLVRRHPAPVLLVGGTFHRSRAFLVDPGVTITDPHVDGGARFHSWWNAVVSEDGAS